MATRLQFKQRVILPEWDGEPASISAPGPQFRLLLLGGLVWLSTLAVGIAIEWYRAEVMQGVSRVLLQARSAFLPEPRVEGRSVAGATLPTLVDSPVTPPSEPAPEEPADSPSRAVAEATQAPEIMPEPEHPGQQALDAADRRIAAGHFGQVEVIRWSGNRHLAGDTSRSEPWAGPVSGDLPGEDDFNDREFLEDLKGFVRSGVARREPGETLPAVQSSPMRRAEAAKAPPVKSTMLSPRPTPAPAPRLREPAPERPRRPEAPRASTAAGGMSCEAARAAYKEQIEVGKKNALHDTPLSKYESILNRGDYFAGCKVPDYVTITICAAVQHGRAAGVTVSTEPAATSVHGCVASGVRRLRFPNNARLDVVTTRFDAAR